MGLIVLVGLIASLSGFASGFLFAILLHDHLNQKTGEIDPRRQ